MSLTVQETAKLCNLSPSRIRKLVRLGRLRAEYDGVRYQIEDESVMDFLAQRHEASRVDPDVARQMYDAWLELGTMQDVAERFETTVWRVRKVFNAYGYDISKSTAAKLRWARKRGMIQSTKSGRVVDKRVMEIVVGMARRFGWQLPQRYQDMIRECSPLCPGWDSCLDPNGQCIWYRTNNEKVAS